MKTWEQVQKFLEAHSLPYRVERFNMSLRGVLVDTLTGNVVASTVREAAKFLR